MLLNTTGRLLSFVKAVKKNIQRKIITAGDSPVISVSEDGIVTALQPSEAEVVASNNSISNVRRIKVVADA